MKIMKLEDLPEDKRSKLELGVMQKRDLPKSEAGLKHSPEGEKKLKIGGYAAKFNEPIMIYDWLEETIGDTAFDEALSGDAPDDVRVLRNHMPDNVLGRTGNGTARLTKDAIGLQYEADLPDTGYARDTYNLVRDGYISGSSFWFRVTAHEVQYFDDGSVKRKITSLKLFDVGPVTFPANESATSEARSAELVTEKRADALFEMLETRIRKLPDVAAPTTETREHLNRKYRDEVALLTRRLEGRK